jgi:hypothetical protein
MTAMSTLSTRVARITFGFWVAALVLTGAWLRLRQIGGPEAFVDEGANILTALDPRVRQAFEPLAQGRPWLVYLFQPAGWFPAHPLLVARLMSAVAGLVTMAMLGRTLFLLAGRAAALCGIGLWAVLPFAVFHERLALQDPFVTAGLAGAVALATTGTLRPGRRNWIWFAAAGLVLGGTTLLKISALFALPWLGLYYLFLQQQAKRPLFDGRLTALAAAAIVPGLTLGRDLGHLGSRLGRYDALPPFTGPGFLAAAAGRTQAWLHWYWGYDGWPLTVLSLGALAVAITLRHRLALACAAGWIASLLVASFGYHNLYARYILPDHLPLILLIALGAGVAITAGGWKRIAALATLGLALMRWGFVAESIATHPAKADVPAAEVTQYFTGPWSGTGLAEVRHYLDDYAEVHQVRCLVLTHRFLRPGCYGLMLTELGDPRIGVVPFTIYEPAELDVARPGLRAATSGSRAAIFLLYEGSIYPAHPWLDAADGPARRVLTVPRSAGESFTLYEIRP